MAESVLRITAIDDDESNLRLVQAVLSTDFEVTTFDRPRAALEALKAGEPPDLIVCDVTMPGLDGFELHEALRAIPALRGVPFVFLTALADRENVRRGMTQGADDYVTKPFTPGDLRDAVNTRLSRTQGLRADESEDLQIVSLGGLEISVGRVRLQWEAKRVAELLLLLLARGGSVSLDEVRRELWWEQPSANYVHVLLSRLRKTLEGVAKVSVHDDVIEMEYEGEVRWDAEAFEAAAREAVESEESAAIERAIAMYGGPFLSGFESPWAERQRIGYEERYVALLEAAVEAAAPGSAAETRATDRLERFLGFDTDALDTDDETFDQDDDAA